MIDLIFYLNSVYIDITGIIIIHSSQSNPFPHIMISAIIHEPDLFDFQSLIIIGKRKCVGLYKGENVYTWCV